jgi:hypothetical protein
VQRAIPSESGDGAYIGDGSGGPTKVPTRPRVVVLAPAVVQTATPTHVQGEPPRADVR